MRWGNESRRGLALAVTSMALLVACPVASADPPGQITDLALNVSAGRVDGLAASPDGSLWYADALFPMIARVTPGSSGPVTETDNIGLQFAPIGGSVSVPTAFAWGPDGSMWFTDNGQSKAIGKVALTWNGATEYGEITDEFFRGLQQNGALPLAGITPGPDGNVWFTDGSDIGRITPAGTVREFSLPVGSEPMGIAEGPDGSLWFTDDGGTPAIGKIDVDGSDIEEFDLPAGSRPVGIAAGPDGNLWFTDDGSTPAIGQIGPDGPPFHEFTTGLLPGSSPNQIAAGPDGSLWVTDDGVTPAIDRVARDGTITPFTMGLQSGGGVSHPEGITADPDGNMWFTDPGTQQAVGYVGTGAPPAIVTRPAVVGSHQEGTAQSCDGATWSDWAGAPPVDQYATDGYEWLRNGTPIAGARSAAYTPAADDLGQVLQCVVTATYPVVRTRAASFSDPFSVLPRTVVGTTLPGTSGTGATSGSGGPRTTSQPAPTRTEVSCAPRVVTMTRGHRKVHVTREACARRLVAATLTLTGQKSAHPATLTRQHRTYATGYARVTRAGLRASLIASRSLSKGTYTIIVMTQHGRTRTVIVRRAVTIPQA